MSRGNSRVEGRKNSSRDSDAKWLISGEDN